MGCSATLLRLNFAVALSPINPFHEANKNAIRRFIHQAVLRLRILHYFHLILMLPRTLSQNIKEWATREMKKKVITAHCHYLCLCPLYIIFKYTITAPALLSADLKEPVSADKLCALLVAAECLGSCTVRLGCARVKFSKFLKFLINGLFHYVHNPSQLS